ncbi:hypothetical protein OIDMADRAFT_144882 [Oidiodendron maius Zn]|uniref:Uncharacterized protein n=1 Tax=Oidiodendron maius (strain Zn) TaxID=913774 RepID=A0A0C3HGT0_OIDMZ|nr:hypothetical protein OIDMADRAFT_144882 [Oidiodendron maius Zn]
MRNVAGVLEQAKPSQAKPRDSGTLSGTHEKSRARRGKEKLRMKSSAPHPETAGDGRRRQECGMGAVSAWIRRENFADGGERVTRGSKRKGEGEAQIQRGFIGIGNPEVGREGESRAGATSRVACGRDSEQGEERWRGNRAGGTQESDTVSVMAADDGGDA